jgi:ABC-type branched-subunit amino acid transport system ATPase component
LRLWAVVKSPEAKNMHAVEFDNVSRLYGDVRAVDGVSIAIRDGEFSPCWGPPAPAKPPACA